MRKEKKNRILDMRDNWYSDSCNTGSVLFYGW